MKQHMAELISDESKEHVIPPAPATTHRRVEGLINTHIIEPFHAFEMLCRSEEPTFRAFNEPKGNCCA